jgi:hypothetical protein
MHSITDNKVMMLSADSVSSHGCAGALPVKQGVDVPEVMYSCQDTCLTRALPLLLQECHLEAGAVPPLPDELQQLVW